MISLFFIFILFIIPVIVGLIVGSLARLIYPGPQHLSIIQTILLGIGGSFFGGFIGNFTSIPSFLVSIGCAALTIYIMENKWTG